MLKHARTILLLAILGIAGLPGSAAASKEFDTAMKYLESADTYAKPS